jgi:uncharacterized protein (DUF2164 family)
VRAEALTRVNPSGRLRPAGVKLPVTLSNDVTQKVLASLRRYFAEQRDEELGDLQSQLLLEFILKEIGPSIYNAAIGDAQVYLAERVADLEGACAVPEFAYWARTPNRRSSR